MHWAGTGDWMGGYGPKLNFTNAIGLTPNINIINSHRSALFGQVVILENNTPGHSAF